MAPILAALLAAIAAGGLEDEPPSPRGGALPEEALAQAPPGVAPVIGEAIGAFPRPPERVERRTYFGTVTVDHRAHLARRSPCRSCHGDGPVARLALGPKVAHDRCRGCHHEQQRGPTGCRGCHVLPPSPPPAAPAALAAAAPAPEEPAPAAAPRPRGGVLAAAMDVPPDRRPRPFERTVMVGVATDGGGGGFAVRLVSRHGKVVFSEGVERVSGSDGSRTLALAGVGLTTPVHPEVELLAIGLGGFDAVDEPALAFRPALAARFGVRWRPTHRWIVEAFEASFTSVVDLSPSGPPGVQRPARAAAFTTLSVGLPLPRR